MPLVADPRVLWGLVPLLALAIFAGRRERLRAARLAAFAEVPMLARLVGDFSEARARLKTALVLFALLVLVIALAGPQWGVHLVHIERRGIDVMFAVDCSRSMDTPDVPPSRMEVARLELGDLIKQLAGNRLGLVGFAGTAFVFCPLTLDVSATSMFLDQLNTSVMPIPGTSLGSAIRTATRAFPRGDTNKKVIVLLTDGEDHHSHPIQAARKAAKNGVAIFTVGIGTTSGQPIPERAANGTLSYLRNASGQVVLSRLDETTLRRIAKLTGGQYIHVDGTVPDALAPIVTAVNGAQKRALEETLQRRYINRFQWFVFLAILAVAIERLIPTRRTPGEPHAGPALPTHDVRRAVVRASHPRGARRD